MNLTESQLLQARIAGMSNLEFDEWLAEYAEAAEEKSHNFYYGEDD